MGRKKGERRTTLVRVYEEFAEKLTQAAGERRLSVAEFTEKFTTSCVDKAHRDYIRAESKRISGGEHDS
jgi:hypothetical protein